MRASDSHRYGLLALTIALGFGTRAQYTERQIIAASGAYAEAGNLKIEYTVGDLVVNTTLAAAAPFTQGFQQTHTDIPTAVPALESSEPAAYPNPTADVARIEWGSGKNGMAMVDLYDALGQRLRRQRVNLAAAYTCDLSPYAVGHYFIRCAPDDGPVMTLPVQKAR